MKKIICIIFCISSINCFSQKGLINYGFIDAKSVGNAKGPDNNSYLVFNKEQSYFVT